MYVWCHWLNHHAKAHVSPFGGCGFLFNKAKKQEIISDYGKHREGNKRVTLENICGERLLEIGRQY